MVLHYLLVQCHAQLCKCAETDVFIGLSIIPIGLIMLIAEIVVAEYGAVGIIGIVSTYILFQNERIALFALAFTMIFFS